MLVLEATAFSEAEVHIWSGGVHFCVLCNSQTFLWIPLTAFEHIKFLTYTSCAKRFHCLITYPVAKKKPCPCSFPNSSLITAVDASSCCILRKIKSLIFIHHINFINFFEIMTVQPDMFCSFPQSYLFLKSVKRFKLCDFFILLFSPSFYFLY